MRGTLLNSSFNLQQKLNGDTECTENIGTENSIVEQRNSVYEKEDQENQFTKNTIIRNSIFKNSVGDLSKNELENRMSKQQLNIVLNSNSSSKRSLKGIENFGSNLEFGKNIQKDIGNVTQQITNDFKQVVQNPINVDTDINKSIKQVMKGKDGINIDFQDNIKSAINQVENKTDQQCDKLKSDIKDLKSMNNGDVQFDNRQSLKLQGDLNLKINQTLKKVDDYIVN